MLTNKRANNGVERVKSLLKPALDPFSFFICPHFNALDLWH